VKIHWKAFTLAKAGNRPEENEDQYTPQETRGVFSLGEGFSCALADGATQTSFSGLWARQLVERASQEHLPTLLAGAQTAWLRATGQMNLPWHAEEKVRLGAFATFLRLAIRPGKSARAPGTWAAMAVGDSCAFQVRATRMLAMAPKMALADFSRAPLLLSSLAARNASILAAQHNFSYAGEWLPGDQFFAMSDALAAWFLGQAEAGHMPWLALAEGFLGKRKEQESFAAWVNGLRAARALKNDDTTLLWLRVGERGGLAEGEA